MSALNVPKICPEILITKFFSRFTYIQRQIRIKRKNKKRPYKIYKISKYNTKITLN